MVDDRLVVTGLQNKQVFKFGRRINSICGTLDRSKGGLLSMTSRFLGALSVIHEIGKPREPAAGAVGACTSEAEEDHRVRRSMPFSGEGATDKHSLIASARSNASRSGSNAEPFEYSRRQFRPDVTVKTARA